MMTNSGCEGLRTADLCLVSGSGSATLPHPEHCLAVMVKAQAYSVNEVFPIRPDGCGQCGD